MCKLYQERYTRANARAWLRLLGFPVAVVGWALLLGALALFLLVAGFLAGAGQLGAHHVAQGGAAGRARRVALRVGQLGGAAGALDRQADLPLHRIDGDDLDLGVLARLEESPRILDALVGDLGDVHQTLDALLQLDEGAEVEDLEDLAVDDLADRVVVGDPIPRVGDELLDPEADLGLLAVLRVDVEHDRLDLVALLVHLRRVLDALRPRHIADVDQAVDALLDLDEDAEVGDVAHPALDRGPRRVLVAELLVRIGLE